MGWSTYSGIAWSAYSGIGWSVSPDSPSKASALYNIGINYFKLNKIQLALIY